MHIARFISFGVRFCEFLLSLILTNIRSLPNVSYCCETSFLNVVDGEFQYILCNARSSVSVHDLEGE